MFQMASSQKPAEAFWLFVYVYLVHVCQEDQVWEQSTGGISLRKGLICLGKVSS